MTTDDVFNEWINQQDWIKWKDPKSVRKAFILWGDFVKDRYAEFCSLSVSGSVCPCDGLANGEIAISSKTLTDPNLTDGEADDKTLIR